MTGWTWKYYPATPGSRGPAWVFTDGQRTGLQVVRLNARRFIAEDGADLLYAGSSFVLAQAACQKRAAWEYAEKVRQARQKEAERRNAD